MNKKFKLALIFFSLIIMTSCVGRRLDSMKSKRAMREYDNSGIILSDGSFFPDKITGFTVDEYLKWYKNLNEPDPERPVNTIILSLGRLISTFLRLLVLAPFILISVN